MGKKITLLLTTLMTLASVGGYLFIDAKIIAGDIKISEGQQELEKAQPELDAGKAKLEAGKQALSAGKTEYEHAQDNKLLVLADNVLNGGKGFEEGREKIAAGDKQVAKGEDKINVGEKRIDAGKLELGEGAEKLKQARNVRTVCAIGAVFFFALSIVLGFIWRKSLAPIFKHSDT